jgi:hypothetical protein
MPEPTNPTRLEAAQRFVMHIGHRDGNQAIGLLSPVVTYRVPGGRTLGGVFSGSAEVAGHLCDLVERTRGTFEAIKWDDWMVGEHHVAAWADIQMRIERYGFAGRVLFLLRFDVGDKIDEIVVLPEDQHAAKRFLDP